mmetsp:Transcript_9765/g.19140  ORF Transcript_9765/g.19140 Transcript_9765/m.19140 type:complete len:84 (-) Transcript_9765:4483-4734(-)
MNVQIDGSPIGEDHIQIIASYTETLENVLILASLKMRKPDLKGILIYFNGVLVSRGSTLGSIGYTEGATLLLQKKSNACCSLI